MARHPVDLLSFVSGVLVLGLGLLLLSGGVDTVPMEWAGPAVAIGLGAFILVAARPQLQANEDEPASSDEGSSASRRSWVRWPW